MNGEYQYRPHDFVCRVLSTFTNRDSARKEEARLLRLIQPHEFGKRYYNLKNGRTPGTPASNKGKPMSEEQKKKLSLAKLGKLFGRLGRPNKNKAS